MTNTDTLTARYEALISDGTRAVVGSVVEHEIEREYGTGDADGARGARMLATAAIKMDFHNLFVELNGSDRGIDGLAGSHLAVLVAAGLEARRCQCTAHTALALRGHRHVDHRCTRHYEADVPAVGDLKLCGDCYAAYADAIGA